MSEVTKNSNSPKKPGRRRIIEWTVLVLIVAVLVGMVFLSIEANKDEADSMVSATETSQEEAAHDTIDHPEIYEEYQGLSEDTVFVRADDSDVINTLSEGSGVVFLGFPGCPWCQGLAPIVDQAAKNVGLDEVMYLDILEHRQAQSSTYTELVSLLDDYLPAGDDGQKSISVPDMTIMKDGEVVARYQPEAPSQEESTPDTYWTEDRTNRVRQQLELEFQKLLSQ